MKHYLRTLCSYSRRLLSKPVKILWGGVQNLRDSQHGVEIVAILLCGGNLRAIMKLGVTFIHVNTLPVSILRCDVVTRFHRIHAVR